MVSLKDVEFTNRDAKFALGGAVVGTTIYEMVLKRWVLGIKSRIEAYRRSEKEEAERRIEEREKRMMEYFTQTIKELVLPLYDVKNPLKKSDADA